MELNAQTLTEKLRDGEIQTGAVTNVGNVAPNAVIDILLKEGFECTGSCYANQKFEPQAGMIYLSMQGRILSVRAQESSDYAASPITYSVARLMPPKPDSYKDGHRWVFD